MRLPRPLIAIRSNAAQALGCVLRLVEPLALRMRRFGYEVRARSRLRGNVAPGVQFIGPIGVEGTGQVSIGVGSRIGRWTFFETQGEAQIDIGENVTINDGVFLTAHAGISVGHNVMVGEYTSIRDANHGIRKGVPVRKQPHAAAPVVLGEDAWIGRGVIVTRGVRVGEGAVVGANSVVTHDVPPYVIVAGAPAKRIGERREVMAQAEDGPVLGTEQ